MIPEFAQVMLWMLAGIALVVSMVVGGGWLHEWLERRPLVRLARQYGIEYVPGESLDKLRAMVVKRRNEGLGEP